LSDEVDLYPQNPISPYIAERNKRSSCLLLEISVEVTEGVRPHFLSYCQDKPELQIYPDAETSQFPNGKVLNRKPSVAAVGTTINSCTS